MRTTQRGGLKAYSARQSYLNKLYKEAVKLQKIAEKQQAQ